MDSFSIDCRGDCVLDSAAVPSSIAVLSFPLSPVFRVGDFSGTDRLFVSELPPSFLLDVPLEFHLCFGCVLYFTVQKYYQFQFFLCSALMRYALPPKVLSFKRYSGYSAAAHEVGLFPNNPDYISPPFVLSVFRSG